MTTATRNNLLNRIEAEIAIVKPYALMCQEHGINITDTKNHGVHQGTVDRARKFCELTAQRTALENAE